MSPCPASAKNPFPSPPASRSPWRIRPFSVEGPKGKLEWSFRPEVTVKFDARGQGSASSPASSDERLARALHGLTRALIQNMVVGVTKGYEKKLEIVGVGYLAAIAGQDRCSCASASPTKCTSRFRPA